MTTMYGHTDNDGDSITISDPGTYHPDGDLVITVTNPTERTTAQVRAHSAAIVTALGGVTNQEFADMSTLAVRNHTRHETALTERDRARDLAARLEAENARLLERDRRQREEIHRWRTDAENRRCIGHTAPEVSQPAPVPNDDKWSAENATLTDVTERLDAILTAVQELRPRVTVRNVKYRTTGNVADIIDELSRCDQEDRLRDLGDV